MNIKIHQINIILLLIALMFTYSCEVFHPKIEVPSYVKIDNISLTTNYPVEGTNSSKITDAWVYIDGNLIGIFTLPSKFPVLAQGNHEIIIKPGIKVNGIAMARGYYPFYQQFSSTINFKPDVTETINPTVHYENNPLIFQWMEDFETSGVTLEKFGSSDTTIEKTSIASQVFEGNYSGIINLTSEKPYALVATINNYVLPKASKPVFIEMNYKTNNAFKVLIYGNATEAIEVLTINPNTDWNKIYLNVTPMSNYSSNYTYYKIAFEATKSSDIEEGIILLDNIKLIFN